MTTMHQNKQEWLGVAWGFGFAELLNICSNLQVNTWSKTVDLFGENLHMIKEMGYLHQQMLCKKEKKKKKIKKKKKNNMAILIKAQKYIVLL